jgi:superfamily II DNA/RNA helicase
MKTFDQFGLSAELQQSLTRINFTQPTPIQQKAIPVALTGRDILGSAQTGTGKTAAFSIPLIEAILRDPKMNALVLTPTRELAKQVMESVHQFLGPKTPIKTAFIIGGESMMRQLQQLRLRPRIIVGTPGRINDHLERGMSLANTGFLVLDETDRMLDMGFGVQLDRIVKHLPVRRQTLMFSATLPQEIIRLSAKYLVDPERIAVGATNIVTPKIQQEIVRIAQDKKYDALTEQLGRRDGSVIVFVKTNYGTEKMAKKLRADGVAADALHGDLRQNKRTSVMNNFRQKKFRILVATDIAARGIDVPHIEHVINYDLPQVAEDYIHRMGRTARAGADGSALCFISPDDNQKWFAIEKLLNPKPPANKNAADGKKQDHDGRREKTARKKPERRDYAAEERAATRSRNDRDHGSHGQRGGDRPARSNQAFGRKDRDHDFYGRGGDDRSARGKTAFGRDGDDRAARGKTTFGRSGEDRPARGKAAFGRGGDDRPARGKAAFGRSGDDRPARDKAAFGRGGDDRPARGKAAFGRNGDDRPARGGKPSGKPAFGKSRAAGPQKPRKQKRPGWA